MAVPGSEERPFVGRSDELKQFDKVLTSPKGQAVIVTGQAGMGKTMLVNRVAKCAKDHSDHVHERCLGTGGRFYPDGFQVVSRML